MCTVEKKGHVYILTLTANDEHRLNPTLITTLQSSLSQIRSEVTQSKSPSALITTAHGKFFSNGYDLSWARSSPGPTRSRQMVSQFQTLVSDLISLPMPTIAAVNGHASAGGFILAMAHDYILMRKDRGFLYMSELDIGLRIPAWFMAVARCKIGRPAARRTVVLTAAKLTAEIGKEIGVVDEVFEGEKGPIDGGVRLGNELVKRGWDGEVYAEIRKGLLKEVLDVIGFHDETVVDGEPPPQPGTKGRRPRL